MRRNATAVRTILPESGLADVRALQKQALAHSLGSRPAVFFLIRADGRRERRLQQDLAFARMMQVLA
eukprot:CAMPEP_0171160298 /NCGR_PEP_ID=MMETSP0790-20130122/3481_1 /TAXON_ID=2925 /ORGANISM="Alexandrium catenella, Strain OF101" /LENGTH=66 /DNA_ID=CAMNT_0011624819 /DNA_START=86 /DNA_END=283 /DNA_ORIENTATION=+